MQLLSVLASPTATFERLKSKGGWVLSLIILCLLSLGAAFVQMPLLEATMMEEMQSAGGEMADEQLAMVMNISKYSAIGGSLVTPVIVMFFVGLLLFLLNLIVRGEGTYMQMSKVGLYSMVPSIIGALITGALAAVLGANTLYDVTLTAGAFFPEKSGFLFTLVSTVLDPFAIWSLVLTVIGASVMSGRSVKTMAIWIVSAWLIVKVIGAMTALLQQVQV